MLGIHSTRRVSDGPSPGAKAVHRSLLPILPAAGILTLALVLFFARYLRDPAPGHEDWAEAAGYIEERWAEGDVVRIEPWWMTSGRVFFADLDGKAPLPFRAFDPGRTLDAPVLFDHQRLWLVAALDARDRSAKLTPPGATLVEESSFERLSLFLFELPEKVVLWNMLQALPSARVEGPRASIQLRQVDGGPHNCVLVRLGKEPSKLRFTLPGEGTLLVRAGNTVEAARAKHGGTVTVTVSLENGESAEVDIPRRDYGLHEMSFTLDREAVGAELLVTLATSDKRKREVCLDGFVLDGEW